MTLRKYVPEVGKIVKMRAWNDYTSRGINVWAFLKVTAVVNETVTFQVMNGQTETNQYSSCPLSAIDAPIGWEPRYTIYCKPEQAEKIVNDWFRRGIVVRQSHDMSGSMPTAFQPMDNAECPHWQFPEVTDAIPASECPKVFRVVTVVTEEITSAVLGFPADPNCSHCHGTGRRSITELANVRKQTVEQVKELIESGEIPLEDIKEDTFRCHCHYGAMSRMGRTKRGQVIKAMRADGWAVRYVPYSGGFWERQKETIVHNWE